MAQNAFSKLLGAIKSRDWSTANEQFSGIMQQKVADRLQTERQIIGAGLVKEDAADAEDEFGPKDADKDEDDEDGENNVHIDIAAGKQAHPVKEAGKVVKEKSGGSTIDYGFTK